MIPALNLFPVESGCLVALTAVSDGPLTSGRRDVSLLSSLARCLAVCLPKGLFVEELETIERRTTMPAGAPQEFVQWFEDSNVSLHCFRYHVRVADGAANYELHAHECTLGMGVETQDEALVSKVLAAFRSRGTYEFCYHLGVRNVMPAPVTDVD